MPPVVFAVYTDDEGERVKCCVDGKQRLTSIQRFFDGQVSTLTMFRTQLRLPHLVLGTIHDGSRPGEENRRNNREKGTYSRPLNTSWNVSQQGKREHRERPCLVPAFLLPIQLVALSEGERQ